MKGISNTDLLARLEAMSFDVEDAQLSFSKRLARDNGWNSDYAQKVIAEYKRFVYLAVIAEHPVTPSDEVDQVWHLHLAYSRHHWDEMCGEILGQPLHHGPTRGGRDESAKFCDWYARTLESYENTFGEKPPVDVWPAPNSRFEGVESWRRVCTQDFLLIPKPRAQVLALGSLVLVLAGCSLDGEFGWLEGFLILALAGVVAWLAISRLRKRARRGDSAAGGKGNSDGGDGGGCGGGCGGCGG